MYSVLMTNSEIASVFERITLILELKGDENPFKVRAYNKAAEMIGSMSKSLQSIYDDEGKKGLQALPGIGPDLSDKIEEMLTTGKLAYLKEVEQKVPEGVLQMMEIEGMGPKKTKFVWKEFKVTTIEELQTLAESGKLEDLKGWGKKSASNIIRGIEMRKKVSGRLPLYKAAPIIEELVAHLEKTNLCEKIEVAGSFRRKRETVGDIDILVISSKPEEVMEAFTNFPEVDTVTGKGSTKSTIFLKAGLDADLRVVEKESFGAALLYFTGSKDHNVRIRKLGIAKGLTLSEYGLYKGTAANKGDIVAAESEEAVYEAIGLDFVPPELREDRGEVEAAQNHSLPELLEVADIKGDTHMHSTFSDGTSTVEDMAKAAKDKGLEYIVIADHASSMGMVKGFAKDGSNMQEYLEALREARKKVKGIQILSGAEVDIEKDGSLYLPDSLLKELDWVVASVHQGYHDSVEENTKRLCTAIQNPYVRTIGHPSARLIGKREGITFDIDTVLKAAKKHGVCMELNTSVERLDLRDIHLKRAKDLGVRISIGSDAHSPTGIQYDFGVAQARRGWLEKADVVNCLPWNTFAKEFSL